MTFRTRQITGWAVLAAAVLSGVAWLSSLDFSRKISTDVLDLIPAGEGAPELTLVRQLAGEAESRTMLFELTDAEGHPAPTEAALAFANGLAADPAFDQAVAMSDTAVRDSLGKEIFDRRLTLLFPHWLAEKRAAFARTGAPEAQFAEWLSHDTADSLGRFLSTPEALAFQDLVPSDPLLLLPGIVNRLKGGWSLVQSPGAAGGAALVWARLSASPLSEAGQVPAFRAIERVAQAVRATFPGLKVADTGVNRFAAASRARIEREMAWLNTLSVVAVLGVALVFIRNLGRALHLIPVVLLAVLGAWVCSTLIFERVHILIFVVGSLLTGVAVDYGFYLFMQPPAFPGEDYPAKVRRLGKPLLASCLTTVAGFALLLLSELPFIRQLGVFVGTGLVSALAAAVLYFATVRNPYLEARTFRPREWWSAGGRRRLARVLLVLGLAALPGLAMLRWKDDIRELDIPSPRLQAEAERIQGLFGERNGQTVYLTYGNSLAEARAGVERLSAWLERAGGGRTRALGVGTIVPTQEEHAQALTFLREHPDFASHLRTALEAAGFDATGFESFFTAWAEYSRNAGAGEVDNALRTLPLRLKGPVALLLHVGRPLCWFVTLASDAPNDAPPADTHTVSAGQLQSLNRVFARYRQSALQLSLVGLGLVGLGVFITYGLRDGVRIFGIPVAAGLGVFGFFGWLGQPLNLFHLLGAFLGVCLAHNYSIFTATSAYRSEAPPVSVRMSALTAAASFGVLSLSGIPVVRALGSTVALMVLVALAMVEFEYLAVLGKKK
ncbi:MAG TPA: MMPL family transporter [Candidatus Didemnitutus sp.]|nr:MMPL family transporter [Candidatus Didemnitutus sp.]